MAGNPQLYGFSRNLLPRTAALWNGLYSAVFINRCDLRKGPSRSERITVSMAGRICDSSVEVESLHAPTGGTVELPCDVRPAQPEDRVGLVIWYKQGHESPIYSLDTREGVTSHWSDPTILGTRASFRTNTTPAVLILTRLRAEDSGQYRCRVDFIKSQTKNTRLNLTVLIPPDRLLIINQDGKEVDGGVLGPYDEDTTVNLTCIAVGGRPTARVSWWKSHALLDNSEGKAKVSLNLHRSDYGTEVTCQFVFLSITGEEEDITDQITEKPVLYDSDVYVVKYQYDDNGDDAYVIYVWIGTNADPSDKAIGMEMAAQIDKEEEANVNVTALDGNITSSVLTFVPSIEDSGRALSCRVVQPTLVHSTREDGWKLEIQYLPVVKLSVGANINAEKVVEGSDVYLDCKVRANPSHSHVSFTHNVSYNNTCVICNVCLFMIKIKS
ncbi:Poliovirus receptor-related protein 2 [Papilio machaon]|uniref:Poliovirus receptor-related protein 2 n=1 Tax=Papilio machaon TaxID=76193 RepID=A0A0N1IH72_PAPMA|nr:Poliovirus receptor-related protein 2 [Papilio machaon]